MALIRSGRRTSLMKYQNWEQNFSGFGIIVGLPEKKRKTLNSGAR